MARITQARRRGLHPESSVTYLNEQTSVSISMDARLYRWVQGMVGRNSFTFCVQEAIVTGLRVMKGELDVSTLLGVMASNNKTSFVEAMYGECEMPVRREAGILMQAAAIAIKFDKSPRLAIDLLNRVPDRDRGLLVKAWEAVAGRDIAAELQSAREEIEREDRRMADQPDFVGSCGSDLEDLIPF